MKLLQVNKAHISYRLKTVLTPFNIILFIGLVLFALSLLIPFIWGLLTSFKYRLDYAANALGFPNPFYWQNYADAYNNFKVTVPFGASSATYTLLGMAVNSVIFSLGGALIQAFCCAFVAYAVAKFSDYKLSKLLYLVVIVAMILPIVGAQTSEIRILNGLGLYNTMFGVLFMKASFLGTYFLVFHAFFRGLPKDYFEAAQLDGAGNFSILFRLVLPMARNIIFIVTLLYFIGNWNDYNVTLLYAPSVPVLSYGLYEFNLSNNPVITSTPHKLAGAMIVFIPVFVLFCAFSKKLIEGNLTMGGVKE